MLTLVVVACNEADRIGRCLDSVPASRKLVLDSGSTDVTVSVARAHGAEVIETDWPGFVAQKNRALALVDTPFALSLDADEWLSHAAAAEVAAVLADPGSAAGWSFPRASEWLGRTVRHGAWYPDRKIRLVRTGLARWVGDDPHDHLEVDGGVVPLAGDIHHTPYRVFGDHLRTIDRYTALNARSLHARGVRARRRDPVVHAVGHFAKGYVLRQGFRDGLPGLALALLGAAHSGLKWHRLRQLGR
ncbi:MAG: glycosyltransferase family 2 protein [Alphaproteobacteria bacterium]|nr:glycosyltransferase family 2 protein [Alphaproteobacteria bacterium]